MQANHVIAVLEKLEMAGFCAYCVGGCVRDLLLGRTPEDWDVATDALPEQLLALFGGSAIPTGLQHGTVTVRENHRSVEVTTFRRDGNYTDGRHPSSVRFVRALEEDLSRRDFTINAMALDLRGNLTDFYGGQADLQAKTLRCVGDPDIRFSEDALRLMRGLRFAAVLGCAIEPNTAGALHRNRERLRLIAAERLRIELTKLICGDFMLPVLREYSDVLGVFLPEILPSVGFLQRNVHHCHDVWEHTMAAMAAIAPTPVLRYTMLFHDIGKPNCFTVDEAGNGHFPGHQRESARLTEAIMLRLKFDHETKKAVCALVLHHDRPLPQTEKSLCRALSQLGETEFRNLLLVKRADNLAQHPDYFGRQQELDSVELLLQKVLNKESCFTLQQLKINGRDVMALGWRGVQVGEVLHGLMERVIDGELENERESLLAAASAYRQNR